MSTPAATDPWRGFVHRSRGSSDPARHDVGAWLVGDDELPGLDQTWADAPLHIRVDRGAGDVLPALTWASRSPARARWLGLGLRDDVETDANVRRVVAALDFARAEGVAPDDPDELALVLSLPFYAGAGGASLPAALLRGLDEIAAAEAVLAVPCDREAGFVAALVDAALDREIAMLADRCPGPASADGRIGWEPLLAGVRASLDGGDVTAALGDGALDLGPDAVTRTRRWLRGAVLTP